MIHNNSYIQLLTLLFFLILQSCARKEESQGKILYDQQCVRCHIGPDIEDLPKNIWKEGVLPDMGARMGFNTPGYDPYKGFSFEDKLAIMKTNIFPSTPVISEEEWIVLQEYILSKAPDSLPETEKPERMNSSLELFDTRPVKLDENPGSYITYLEYLPEENKLAIGDIQNNLKMYDFKSNQFVRTVRGSSPVIKYNKFKGKEYITQIGRLNPSEIPAGSLSTLENDQVKSFNVKLHRPVYSSVGDLDKDGSPEFVLSEFGHFTGKLSLLKHQGDSILNKTLLNKPGTIRTLIRDMNNDGKDDIIALTSQGDENITIMYQNESMEFNREKVIRFSPIYGSSWFELMDYDQDGDLDIATVHGDNADKTPILKPYHGLRIHINDGDNNFKESFFYPLDGATRVVARDFEQDGDIDFALIATFPDYEEDPMRSFVYLENKNQQGYEFTSSTFEAVNEARWFLMDAGDIDGDGDL
ncbi:MAG TPA: VCBS repeat-containing protein, partial [Christiangramia sp.]|nr:VCBS repeat-containing protein [Christiangramia sp.]